MRYTKNMFTDLQELACRDHVLENTPERLGWLEPVPDIERSDRKALWARLERDATCSCVVR